MTSNTGTLVQNILSFKLLMILVFYLQLEIPHNQKTDRVIILQEEAV